MFVHVICTSFARQVASKLCVKLSATQRNDGATLQIKIIACIQNKEDVFCCCCICKRNTKWNTTSSRSPGSQHWQAAGFSLVIVWSRHKWLTSQRRAWWENTNGSDHFIVCSWIPNPQFETIQSYRKKVSNVDAPMCYNCQPIAELEINKNAITTHKFIMCET